MQQPPPAPPAPPAPPTPVAGADVIQVPSRPLTASEIQAIRERRGELSNQLNSAADRRQNLAEELREASGPVDRAGLEERIRVLDERIVQLETDIATTGRQLTTGQTLGETSTEMAPIPFGLENNQVTGISIVFILAVMFPLSIAMAHCCQSCCSPEKSPSHPLRTRASACCRPRWRRQRPSSAK